MQQNIKYEIKAVNFMAIGYQHKKLCFIKFEKVVKFYVHTCPVFTGPVTILHLLHNKILVG